MYGALYDALFSLRKSDCPFGLRSIVGYPELFRR